MKSYFNHAIIGNSKLLTTLDQKSQILRIFWPHIDYHQHIDKLSLGVYFPGISNTMHWLDSDDWVYEQQYIEDTNILKTIITSYVHQVTIIFADFVIHDRDVIVRNIEIRNVSESPMDINFAIYVSGTTSKTDTRSATFDFDSDAVVFYRHKNYMFIGANRECKQFQLTGDPFDACNRLFLYGAEDFSLSPQGAMLWEFGTVNPNEKVNHTIYITLGHNMNKTRDLFDEIKRTDFAALLEDTKKYWHDFLLEAKSIKTEIEDINTLYRRSLLALKLMSDETGGIIATPEFDEDWTKSGKYGYCWPRDAAFITTAFDRVGLTGISREFYEWAIRAQDKSGCWLQRYFVDGSLAPSWGTQLDETGSILYGMWHYYIAAKDRKFLEFAWDSVYKASEFLVNVIDRETGLHTPCYDMWENKTGQHAYTSAAIYGGLMAAHNIAKELGKDNLIIEKWYNEAQNLKNAIETKLWDKGNERFLKSIDVKLNPWGDEPGEKVQMVVNKKGFWRDFSPRDDDVDSNLLGLVLPFGVFDANDSRILKTARYIEERLSKEPVGGIKRYENDDYIGGNPWIICTLWLAMYYMKVGRNDDAKSLILWSMDHKTKLGLLPEQVDKDTGQPAWAIPLAWSHAMFIHAVLDAIEGEIFKNRQ